MDKNAAMALKLRAKILSRYTHEKKTIVFFMYTCRKLRNLAKERTTLKKAANGLMYVAILLLKKGIIMNNCGAAESEERDERVRFGRLCRVREERRQRAAARRAGELRTACSTTSCSRTSRTRCARRWARPTQQRTQDVLKLVEDGNENVKSVEDELQEGDLLPRAVLLQEPEHLHQHPQVRDDDGTRTPLHIGQPRRLPAVRGRRRALSTGTSSTRAGPTTRASIRSTRSSTRP
jgi:hypothetical protein